MRQKIKTARQAIKSKPQKKPYFIGGFTDQGWAACGRAVGRAILAPLGANSEADLQANPATARCVSCVCELRGQNAGSSHGSNRKVVGVEEGDEKEMSIATWLDIACPT